MSLAIRTRSRSRSSMSRSPERVAAAVGGELMLIQAIVGTTVSVERGLNGTAGVPHPSGAVAYGGAL